MQDKFLKEVVTIVVGKQSERIVDLMNGTKNVNEYVIAKKLEITVNQVRNILYKLSDQGLVSFIRKKDKKKGWYTYFWKIEVLKSLEFYRDHLRKLTNQLNNQIRSRETKIFYFCERCGGEFTEENALIHNFICSECGGVFTLKDNTKFLRELKKNYGRLDNQLKLIEVEIGKEKEKEEKKRAREIKKETIEKAKKRMKNRALKKPKKKVKKIVKKKQIKKSKKKSKKKIKKEPIKKSKKKVEKSKKRVKKKPIKKLKKKKKK